MDVNTKPLKLSKRFEIRCEPAEYRRWTKKAAELKMPNLAAFVRKAANDASTK